MIVKKLSKARQRDQHEFVLVATRDELKTLRAIAGKSTLSGLDALQYDAVASQVMNDIYYELTGARLGMNSKVRYR